MLNWNFTIKGKRAPTSGAWFFKSNDTGKNSPEKAMNSGPERTSPFGQERG